jgi:hypothetical protein
MTNREAFKRAIKALDKASEDTDDDEINSAWSNMATHEIYDHILRFLEKEFKQD